MAKAYYIKGVHRVVTLESFAKFTEKHLCWSHFSIKLQA